jgi:RNase H-fold protein (predicted Holliday junction resolvase)
MIKFKEAVKLLSLAPNSNIFSIDPGVRKLGLARATFHYQLNSSSSSSLSSSFPVCTLRAPVQLQSQEARDDFLSIALLGTLRSQLPITLVICGDPFLSSPPSTKEGIRFATTIQRIIKTSSSIAPVLLWDEAGSSATARSLLRSESSTLQKRQAVSDSDITKGIRFRQRLSRSLPVGLRESVDEQSAVVLVDSFIQSIKWESENSF